LSSYLLLPHLFLGVKSFLKRFGGFPTHQVRTIILEQKKTTKKC
jgi:hypothetical protein